MPDHLNFAPIFIVGTPRSGTTLLSVLFDRHSQVSIPPETHFFNKFLKEHPDISAFEQREDLVAAALSSKRMVDLALDPQTVMSYLPDGTLHAGHLLRAILQAYATRDAKPRYGEKTPAHLRHVPRIFELFPNARAICIVRDGRDTALSSLAAWGDHDRPSKLIDLCCNWNFDTLFALDLQRTLPDRFTIVQYETLLVSPEAELRRLCDFLDLAFEPGQLDTEVTTSVVPTWEQSWKGKAVAQIDPSRIEAWRRSPDPQRINVMNAMMGPVLRRMGYRDTQIAATSWRERLAVRWVAFRYRTLRNLRRRVTACYGS